MPNMKDLLGAMFESNMTPTRTNRIEHSLSENGIGGEGGLLTEIFGDNVAQKASPQVAAGAMEDSGLLGSLGGIAKSILGQGDKNKSVAAGGLGALAGALLSGGKGSAKGAIGGGAMALLGTLAFQAFRNAQGSKATDMEIDPAAKLTAGLREPENAQEEQEVHSIAELTLRAMINAAKADGKVDEQEIERVVGKVNGDGVSSDERDFLVSELRKPVDTAGIASDVPNQQVAAQVYAASVLAIDLDTQAEKRYLQDFGNELGLDRNVVGKLNSLLNVT